MPISPVHGGHLLHPTRSPASGPSDNDPHGCWKMASSCVLGVTLVSAALTGVIISPSPALAATVQQQQQQQHSPITSSSSGATRPVIGGLGSETEDKLLEAVRQIETRMGSAAGLFPTVWQSSDSDKVSSFFKVSIQPTHNTGNGNVQIESSQWAATITHGHDMVHVFTNG